MIAVQTFGLEKELSGNLEEAVSTEALRLQQYSSDVSENHVNNYSTILGGK